MIKGTSLDKNLLTKVCNTTFDLSGASQSEYALFNAKEDIEINSISLLYVEASSSDSGVAINFGNFSSAVAYGTTTTEVSKSIGYVKTIDAAELTDRIVRKGVPLIVANAGSKVGTGNVIVSINYTVL